MNTAVFSWIQAVVLRPLPGVADAKNLQLVEPRTETGSHPGSSWLEYRDLAARARSFDHLAASRMVPINLGEGNRTERIYGQLVSGNYFTSLGLRPALGRLLRPDDTARPGSEPVVSSRTFSANANGGAQSVGQMLAQRPRVRSSRVPTTL